MKYINLYQAAFHPPKVVLPAHRLLAGALVFLAALLALYAWDALRLQQLRVDVGQLAAKAERIEAGLKSGMGADAADPAVIHQAVELETRLRNLGQAQSAMASGAFGPTQGYSAQFRALARGRNDGAWLTRVSIAERGAALNLSGRALTGEDTARLILRLGREPEFAGLAFSSLNIAPPKQEKEEAGQALPRFLEFTLLARPSAAAATPPVNAEAVKALATQHGVVLPQGATP